MMKPWLAAAAAAPLLIACASAGAQTAAERAPETRVLIVNGERIVIDERGDAAAAIERALERSEGSRRVVLEFEDGGAMGWSEREREAFASAMAELADAFGEDFDGEFDFDFDFDFDADGDVEAWSEAHEDRIDMMVRRIERDMERRTRHIERHAERMEREAERMALRVERHAARAEVHGLRAGVRGVEQGLSGVEETLDRGWHYEWRDGERERVELTDEKRADLEEAREDLLETLEDLRADLAEAEARHGGNGREVRIVRRDGRSRATADGDEAADSDLDTLLDGGPEDGN